jgi:NAD(P)H-dependent flavin oxidoreductase YrpB (nitropropane dioxygenase family)
VIMQSAICELLNIEFPLVAFSHCRDVVVEVSKAGGMGVLGAVGLSAAELETELAWIDENINGKPYGVDLLIPHAMIGKGEQPSRAETLQQVPAEHKQFTRAILESHGIVDGDVSDDKRAAMARFGENMREEGARKLLDVAFAHPIGLIANALGVPPPYLLEWGKSHGVPVAALVGAKEHAVRQVAAGVDILVVAGGEAGGHCGDVSTLVLVPEVYEAIKSFSEVPILAAGGIVTGQQMAACMAMGAAGVWTGSVWLTTAEAETSPVVKEKMLAASSRETVRSKARTGKYSRQLRSAWTDAWEHVDAPEPLPMPLQSIVTEPVLAKVEKLAEGGHEGAKQLATYWVGQGVGMMNATLSVRVVVENFMEEFLGAQARLQSFLDD